MRSSRFTTRPSDDEMQTLLDERAMEPLFGERSGIPLNGLSSDKRTETDALGARVEIRCSLLVRFQVR